MSPFVWQFFCCVLAECNVTMCYTGSYDGPPFRVQKNAASLKRRPANQSKSSGKAFRVQKNAASLKHEFDEIRKHDIEVFPRSKERGLIEALFAERVPCI